MSALPARIALAFFAGLAAVIIAPLVFVDLSGAVVALDALVRARLGG